VMRPIASASVSGRGARAMWPTPAACDSAATFHSSQHYAAQIPARGLPSDSAATKADALQLGMWAMCR
jgi:hypothetical protein